MATYRLFRQARHDRPFTPPEAKPNEDQIHAIGIGATDNARRRLFAGSSEKDLREIEIVEWDGLDTAIEPPDAEAALTSRAGP